MDAEAPRRLGLIRAPSVFAALVALAAALAPGAHADGPGAMATKAPAMSPPDDLWQRDKLTGDWGGARTKLSQRGVDITFNYIGETLGMLGGIRQGVSYEHRFELSI